jgi:hypothetical protein
MKVFLIFFIGKRVEKSRFPDRHPLPWHHLFSRSLHQLLHLGQALERGHPVHDHAVDGSHVVRNLAAASLCRLLLRISKATLRATRQDKPG